MRRHPAVEALVFALALVSAGFVARELLRRRPARPAAPAAVEPFKTVAVPARGRPTASSPSTERAVSSLPSIKLSRVQRRRPRRDVPPPPAGGR